MRINTCIDVGTGDDYVKRCEPSMPFQVTIRDPCYDTQIIKYAFPAGFVFEVPILQSRRFSVPTEILQNPVAQFPWPNTINEEVDDVYGTDVCGPIAYSLTQLEPPMATLNPDLTVDIEPIKDVHLVGTYTFYLVGTLTDYGYFAQTEFTVRVTTCEATLDVTNAALPVI